MKTYFMLHITSEIIDVFEAQGQFYLGTQYTSEGNTYEICEIHLLKSKHGELYQEVRLREVICAGSY